MPNQFNKKNIATGALALMAGASIFMGTSSGVRICDTETNVCRAVSASEYRGMKQSLAGKISDGEAITWNEYLLFHGILNKELKGSRDIGPIKNRSDLTQTLTQILYD